ncbi:DUF177 domain-containing protein [Lentisphaerota bacterium WC36G]|nr:DUF177 domain-containing protein [Lentisphaerae bacterium WC36]
MKNELKISIANLDSRGADYSGILTKDFLILPEHDTVQLISDIEYNLHLTKVIGGVLISGEVSFEYASNCGKCLEDYEQNIDKRIDIFLDEPELNEIDLTEQIREEIALALPDNSICSEDCQGLCVACGKNLNHEQCECEDDFEEESPWSALDNLDLD